MQNLKVPTDLLPPLVFVATGGGAAPMIDFVEFLVQQKAVLKNKVFLYYRWVSHFDALEVVFA